MAAREQLQLRKIFPSSHSILPQYSSLNPPSLGHFWMDEETLRLEQEEEALRPALLWGEYKSLLGFATRKVETLEILNDFAGGNKIVCCLRGLEELRNLEKD